MKHQLKIKSVDAYLENIIKESLKSALQKTALQEKEKQDSSSLFSSEKENETEKLKKGEISTSDIVEKLNSIRSGKSFKDEEIASKIEKYINDLSKAEKVALLAFLKGISQIVTGEIDPSSATEPSDKPANVQMTKTGGVEKKSIKPTVIKAPEAQKEKKSVEDTTGPVPITPKKK